MKITILSACSFLLLITLDPETVPARESYWEEHHIELSGLSEEQIMGLESTMNQLRSLEPGELKINKKMYGRLTRHF